MHKILLYNHSYDETFFVNRFIERLKPEIKNAIKLQLPGTVELALSLAQTQEVLLVHHASKEVMPWCLSSPGSISHISIGASWVDTQHSPLLLLRFLFKRSLILSGVSQI